MMSGGIGIEELPEVLGIAHVLVDVAPQAVEFGDDDFGLDFHR